MDLDKEMPSQSSSTAGKELPGGLCVEGWAWPDWSSEDILGAVVGSADLTRSTLPQHLISKAALPTAGHRSALQVLLCLCCCFSLSSDSCSISGVLMAGQSSLLSCSTVLASLQSMQFSRHLKMLSEWCKIQYKS